MKARERSVVFRIARAFSSFVVQDTLITPSRIGAAVGDDGTDLTSFFGLDRSSAAAWLSR